MNLNPHDAISSRYPPITMSVARSRVLDLLKVIGPDRLSLLCAILTMHQGPMPRL